jgi:hypothetical protein
MHPVCNTNHNFVDSKDYEQVVIKDVNDPSVEAPTQDVAYERCRMMTQEGERFEGRDFFYQQHENGHTICGFFESQLNEDDTLVQHEHKFGGVCKIPNDYMEKVNILGNKVDTLEGKVGKFSSIQLSNRLHSVEKGLDTLDDKLDNKINTLDDKFNDLLSKSPFIRPFLKK